MKKIIGLIIALMLPGVVSMAIARDTGNPVRIKDSKTYTCGDKVKLRGMLVKRVGMAVKGDKEYPTYFPALSLVTPISMKNDADETCGNVYDVGTLHMQLAGKEWDVYNKNIGKVMTVSCNLDVSSTAHHHEPIMCFDAKIEN